MSAIQRPGLAEGQKRTKSLSFLVAPIRILQRPGDTYRAG